MTATAGRAWEPDVLPGYHRLTLPLGVDPDGEGEVVATLVRRGPAAPAARAVLAVHGYTDYFFHTEVADHAAARGLAFYALDLRRCGRSWRPGQTPHYIGDLSRYDVELDAALARVHAETGGAVIVYGHSAGGLVTALWLDRLARRGRSAVCGLVLNSPFLDLQGPPVLRSPWVSALLEVLGRVAPRRPIPLRSGGAYGRSLHRDFGGDFDYDLAWKPPGGFPVTFGWLRAVRRGQAALHRGLDVGVPSLVLRSDRSVRGHDDPHAIRLGDAVLDVAQIARWSGCLGGRTTVVPIVGAKHDVFLSLDAPRRAAFAELGAWLDAHAADIASGRGAPDSAELPT